VAHADDLELKMWEISNVAAKDPSTASQHSTEMTPSVLLRMHIFEMSEITKAI